MEIKIDKIIRTKRNSIALQITDDATLIVRAPFHVNDEIINRVVQKHRDWIVKKKKQIAAKDPKFSPKEFVNGEGFLYLGKYYKLKIVENQKDPLKFKNGFYLSKKYLPKAREIFLKWYKKRAYEKISERVKVFEQKRCFKYNKINITNAQKRWGSCSRNGNLNFALRLIMAPLPVIDYVVIHELVHLEEKSHTQKFWEMVKILMPDYDKYKKWLKEYGHILKI